MSSLAIDTLTSRLGVLHHDAERRDELCALLRRLGYGQLQAISDSELGGGSGWTGPLDLILFALDEADPELVRRIAERYPDVPLLAIIGDASAESRRRAARLEVTDFLVDPVEPEELQMRIRSQLGTTRLRRMLADRSARLTEALRDHSAELGTVRESISVLAAVADFHDDDTDRHAHRVGALSGAIARSLGLTEDSAGVLTDAAPLHDIGKVGISRRILLKPGSLSPSERIHMMQHVEIGAQILASAQSPVLILAAEIARTHHERWDGSGYTAGLTGEEIPLSGRIVAVADVWDTLTHDRPYRTAWPPERALNEILNQSGSHFDPRVVEAFSSLELAAPVPDGVRVA